mmetsp:Transcript_11453/g.32960  ORF Transcript_11453/g.32960 Transcript_11453/m.32960 type:complete len:209 (-) Transcript_11453:1130-1756(-)
MLFLLPLVLGCFAPPYIVSPSLLYWFRCFPSSFCVVDKSRRFVGMLSRGLFRGRCTPHGTSRVHQRNFREARTRCLLEPDCGRNPCRSESFRRDCPDPSARLRTWIPVEESECRDSGNPSSIRNRGASLGVREGRESFPSTRRVPGWSTETTGLKWPTAASAIRRVAEWPDGAPPLRRGAGFRNGCPGTRSTRSSTPGPGTAWKARSW